jgi:hypothetical protein
MIAGAVTAAVHNRNLPIFQFNDSSDFFNHDYYS